MFVKTVEELVIYQIALKLTKEVNELIKQIPNYWNIEECKQILRSSSSCPSNIKEGFAQRFYVKQFIKYLYIAMGSSDESQDHLEKLSNNGHMEVKIANYYIGRYKNLSVRIVNLVSYLRKRHNIKTLP